MLLIVPIFLCFCVGAVTPEVAVQTQPETRELPILMYHKVLNSKKSKYIVSEKQLEADFLRLKQDGYETVFLSQVIDWVDGRGDLPPKPIVLTFDDGHYNNFHYALPLAQKHGIKFMIFPVTSFSQHTIRTNEPNNANYSHLTFEQMNQAVQTGLVEIGSHTHNMHKFKPRFGIAKVGQETTATYKENLVADIATSLELIEEAGVPRPKSFAYPFGKYSKESRDILREMGFRAMLTCSEKVNTITQGQEACLHELGRYNRDGGKSTDRVFDILKNRKQSK